MRAVNGERLRKQTNKPRFGPVSDFVYIYMNLYIYVVFSLEGFLLLVWEDGGSETTGEQCH